MQELVTGRVLTLAAAAAAVGPFQVRRLCDSTSRVLDLFSNPRAGDKYVGMYLHTVIVVS